MIWNRIKALSGILRRSRWFGIGVNAGLGLVLILWVARSLLLDTKPLLQAINNLDFSCLIASLGFYGINFVLFIIAWHRIVIRFGGPFDWKQNVLFYAYTNLTRFLPTPFWFYAARVYSYAQSGLRPRVTLTATALETVLHILTGVFFYALLMINPEHPITWLYLFILLPWFVMFVRPDWLKLRWVVKEVNLNIRRQDVVIWLIAYLATWVTAGPFFLAIVLAFNKSTLLSLSDLWCVWTLASLMGYIGAYTLGGMGILRDFTLVWLLGRFYSSPVAVLIAASVRLMMILGGVLWGVVISGFAYFFLRRGQIPYH